MFINLKDVASKGVLRLEETVDLHDSLTRSASLTDFGPLEVRLEASDKHGAAEVTGELAIEVEQPCSRCLAPVRQKLIVPFHEVFALGEGPEDDDPEDEENAIEWVPEERIELKPYLVESVMLALPYVPLCDEACQGLCPVCGENRNEHACGCKQDKVDPRLAGLADFFKQTKE